MTKRKKMYVVCVLVVLALLASAAFLYQRARADKGAQTTSKSPTAQSDYSDGKERSNSQEGSTQGTGVDTNGEDVPATPGKGVTSESGAITVLSPASNGVFATGNVLSGKTSASVNKVQYRVIDEVNGVVVQGSLSVVDGAFSGKIHFNAQSKSGRLDVFSFDDAGSEINNIEMSVQFKE